MQSDVLWIKNLARASYQNGRWIPDESPVQNLSAFESLVDDIIQAVETYNQHAKSPIRILDAPAKSTTLLTLLHGMIQLKFLQNGNLLDVSLIKTRNFQTQEVPLARLSPILDVFGYPTWKRGTVEWSTDQLIKQSFIHLLEASQSP